MGDLRAQPAPGAGPAMGAAAAPRWEERPWPGLVRPDPDHWLWLAGDDPAPARAEADRLAWLGPRYPCPRVVVAADTWLVTTAPSGSPATEPERQPRPDDVPAAVGAALRRLHQLPTAGCPFDRGAEVEAEIGAALAQGRLDPARLPSPYDRYRPERLVELIAGGPPVAAGERVVCHGAPVLTRWFLDQGRLGAVVGVHRLGLADPHLDLAVAYRSLQRWFGPEAVYGFLEGYGQDPDLIRLDHHILVDVVLGAIAPPVTAPGPPAGSGARDKK